jgi:hypothetical protein
MSIIKRLLLLTLVIGCALTGHGCYVKVRMNESVPPTFTFSQNGDDVGYLDFFAVTEIAAENVGAPPDKQDWRKDVTIWKIWPKGTAEGTIANLPPITYGVVPEGFTQEIPTEGPPPPLAEGRVYRAGGPGVSMPWGVMRFTVRDGKVVELPMGRPN